MNRPLALALLLALGACGTNKDDAGGLADDDRLLNNAAAMLDANNVSTGATSTVSGNTR